MPGRTPSAILAATVEAALNGYLKQDEEVRARLEGMAGRVICMELLGTGVSLFVQVGSDRVRVSSQCVQTPDVTLRGTLPMLMRSAIDPAGDNEIELVGDVGLGQRFQQVIADVEPDWEEKLASVVGDVAAHQLGRFVRGAMSWGTDTWRTVEANVGEYLQEESRDLPATAEVRHFQEGVDRLRSDVDRLEARIRRLRTSVGSGPK